jgi:hypothetical protein
MSDDIDSLRLELEAERHNHRKDNEHFMAEIEWLRAALDRLYTENDKAAFDHAHAVLNARALGEKT